MNLKVLLTIHAVITFAAAVVLIVTPYAIPQTVDIHLQPNEYLLSYFLGAAELAIAYLSFYGRKVGDTHALRVITGTCIVFHAATGLLELYAVLQGGSPKIIANSILRVVIVALFYYYGLRKNAISSNGSHH